MSRGKQIRVQRPRELRRRVVLPARLLHGSSWSDACILNVSSRGLMIHTGRPLAKGTEIELRRGCHVIVARVMWRDGARAGLRSDTLLPIAEIVTLGRSPTLQLTAAKGERRRHPRQEDASRIRGRWVEFAGVLAFVLTLAGAGVSMIDAALARPLNAVVAALGG